MNNIETIYMFGVIGKLNKLPKGGSQTSARRIIKGLENTGFRVVPISRRQTVWQGKLAHKVEVMLFAVIDLIKIIGKIIFQKRSHAAFMFLTYSGPLVPYEYICSKVVTMLGYRSITYIKGGQVLDFYNSGSEKYKTQFKKNMDMQSLVMFEGKEALEFVKTITDTKLVYFPNYIFEENIAEMITERPKGRINICYFGRIDSTKNIHVIIEMFDILCKKHGNIYLTLVGEPLHTRDYADLINEKISASPNSDHIVKKEYSPFSYIKEMMQSQHFFIFPTEEICEGHSNSLNEAMSQGVIPVVSDFHYNKSIVGNDFLVVKGYDPKDYADRVEYLINNCDLHELSLQMRDRVRNHYSYSVVNSYICDEIRKI